MIPAKVKAADACLNEQNYPLGLMTSEKTGVSHSLIMKIKHAFNKRYVVLLVIGCTAEQ